MVSSLGGVETAGGLEAVLQPVGVAMDQAPLALDQAEKTWVTRFDQRAGASIPSIAVSKVSMSVV